MASQYDVYRDDILALKTQGMNPAEILRQLMEDNPGKDFKQSSFYDYLKKLGVKDAEADQAAQRFLAEIAASLSQLHGTVHQLTQAVTEMDAEAAKRHEQVLQQQAMQRPVPVSQAYAPPMPLYRPGAAPPAPVSWRLPKLRIPKSVIGLLFLIGIVFVLMHIDSVDWRALQEFLLKSISLTGFQPKTRI